MLWTDYLASRTAVEAEALVNMLTVGFGTLAGVVRRIARDDDHREIVALLATVEFTLDQVYCQLPRTDGRTLLPAITVAAGLRWSDYLARRTAAEQTVLRSRLQLVLLQARVTGEQVHANGEVTEIVRLLGGVLDHLQALRRDLTTAQS